MAEQILMSEMTWTEVDEALADRPVALIPVGAVEAHGPHLPLLTDAVIATEMARRGAKKLKAHGLPSLILPPVYFTVAPESMAVMFAAAWISGMLLVLPVLSLLHRWVRSPFMPGASNCFASLYVRCQS